MLSKRRVLTIPDLAINLYRIDTTYCAYNERTNIFIELFVGIAV